MIAERITLKNFRNVAEADFVLSPRATLLVGPNGHGKTNVLEAIYLLWRGRSFRTHAEGDFFPPFGDLIELTAGIRDEAGRALRLEHRISRHPARRAHRGPILPVVLFSPEDVELVSGAPSLRRDFLDDILVSLDTRYRQAVRVYAKALSQRNRALKDEAWRAVANDFLPVLIHEGLYIWRRREELAVRLWPGVVSIYGRIAAADELAATLSYGGCDERIDTVSAYQQRFAERQQDERVRGQTLVGPHRDDWKFSINARPAVGFASRGQMRTLSLSLKLASFDLLKEETGMSPLVLLDDVLSELDPRRREEILRMVAGSDQQTVITDTEPRNYQLAAPRIYRLERGMVRAE